MNVKRFALSCVAVYIVNQILGFLIHEVWLGETYRSLADVWRPEAEMKSMMWVMFLTSAVWSIIFCYVFVKGYEGRGPMEGVRYGLLMGLFFGIPFCYESYVIYPVPLSLAHKWFITTIALTIISGVIAALVYKPAPSEA